MVVNARASPRGAGAARCSGTFQHPPRNEDSARLPDRGDLERRIELGGRAGQSDTAGSGREVVVNADPLNQRPDFGRLAVGVAEFTLGCALLFTFGDQCAAVLRLFRSEFLGELVRFGAYFVGHAVVVESGDLVQSLANLGEPYGELHGGSHRYYLSEVWNL